MIHELLASYRMTLDLIERAVADLSRDQATTQPSGVPNHPAWTVGHLVHSAQAIGGELGLDPWLPEEWGDRFGTGSTPVTNAEAYPPMEELMAQLRGAAARIERHLRERGEEVLAAPLPDVRYRDLFPTTGHAALHILAGHTSFHAGQIMVWRRAAGLPTEPAL